MQHQVLLNDIRSAFHADVVKVPSLTLRAGDEVDDYLAPPPYNASLDEITDKYLETYAWGVYSLDAASWKHYLPSLLEYTLRKNPHGGHVTSELLKTLRPPDRIPSRLGTLTRNQEYQIARFLDTLTYIGDADEQRMASQLLKDWWAPRALRVRA